MIEAVLMLLIGLAIIALGLVQHTMYDIGVAVVLLAGMGITVRSIELLVKFRRFEIRE